MARKRLEVPPVRREIYLDPQISAILETLFLNTLTGKAQYGQVNLYIVGLIRQDLTRRGLLGQPTAGENKA